MKRIAKTTLVRSGILRVCAALRAQRIAILRYHSVLPADSPLRTCIGEGIVHDSSVFDQQMALLSGEYNVVSLDDVYSCIMERKPLAHRSVVVTFDDGFRDNHAIAAPIMEAYGLTGTFYVTAAPIETGVWPWFCRLRRAFHLTKEPGLVSSENGHTWDLRDRFHKQEAFREHCRRCARLTGYEQQQAVEGLEGKLCVPAPLSNETPIMLSWEHCRALGQRGHIIGCHTMTHPNVAHVEKDLALGEMRESRALMEKRLGSAVRHFSYPSPILEPHWSDVTTELCIEVGFKTAVTCRAGALTTRDRPWTLPRLAVPGTATQLEWILERTFAAW